MDAEKRQAMSALADKAEAQGNMPLANALRKTLEMTSPEKVAERQEASDNLFAQLDAVQARFDAAMAVPLLSPR